MIETYTLYIKTFVKLGLIAILAIYLGSAFPKTESTVVTPVTTEKSQLTGKTVNTNDYRKSVLKAYLEKRNSPMTDSAGDFIAAADQYGVDWKLVPAIAGVESTFGKHIPGGHDPIYTSYNSWGWGVYGTNVKKFASWKDGIYTLNKGLKEKYINRGLTTPMAMNRVYAASPTWGTKVTFFINDLEKFEKEYLNQHKLAFKSASVDPEKNSIPMTLDIEPTQLAFK